jgi:hypothetical protein
MPTYRIGLVACSASKVDHPAPARELYTSALFRKSADYVEKVTDVWFVLSAKHALLDPSTVVEPYNMRLGVSKRQPGMEPSPPIWGWAKRVVDNLAGYVETVPSGWSNVELVVLAGEQYRTILRLMPNVRHVTPLAGLGIGDQLGWLTREARRPARRMCRHKLPLMALSPDDSWFACGKGCAEFAPGWIRDAAGVALRDVVEVGR